jgi:ABC-type branched-subunit amino acid transport system ATPase component
VWCDVRAWCNRRWSARSSAARLGIAGVAGNGQDELVEALTGLRKPAAGRVELAGRDVTGVGPRELQRAGMSFVPGDRHRFGLVLSFPIEDNLVLTQYDEAPYARGPFRNDAAIREWAKRAIGEYDIRTPSSHVSAGTLSGGNQQKAVVAREFSRELSVLVLDQPTRGLDVGSIEFIHRQVIAKRDAGAAILLVSAELDEVMELSDRIGVMYRGELVALVDGPSAQREEIGLLMATGRRDAQALAATTTSMTAAVALEAGADPTAVTAAGAPAGTAVADRPEPPSPPDEPRTIEPPTDAAAFGAPDDSGTDRTARSDRDADA